MSDGEVRVVIRKPECWYEAHYNHDGSQFEIYRVRKGVRRPVSHQERTLCEGIINLQDELRERGKP